MWVSTVLLVARSRDMLVKVIDLFKYYSPKYKNSDNLSFYSKGEIFFQKPIKFNDPWDCKSPPIQVNRQINSLRCIWEKLSENNGHIFNDDEWNKLSSLGRSEVRQYFTNLFQEAFDKQRSKIGVFSLSFIPDSELMWSHYAKSHLGYMLHFQIDLEKHMNGSDISNIGTPIPVIYKNSRESWNLLNYYKNREKHILDLVRFKSSAWEYERELRILNTAKNGFIKTPKNWLKSIVIGINADDKLREELHRIGRELGIQVLSSKMSKNKFKIEIPGLGIDGVQGEHQYKFLIDSKFFEL